VLTVLVFVKHAPNIGRLVKGTEGKISLSGVRRQASGSTDHHLTPDT
jgi:hypothetical protein